MKKSFLAGMLFLCIVLIVSMIINDWSLIFNISGGIGIISILLSGLFLGVFVSGYRIRANFHSEDQSKRTQKSRYANFILAFGFPNLLAAIAYLLFI